MRHFRIARQTVFVLLLHLPHVGFAQKLEENTDRHGEDFRDFDLPSPDPLLCRKACVEDDQCGSFTYLKPNSGLGSPQVAHCWLKSGIPAAKHDSSFVSRRCAVKDSAPGKTGGVGGRRAVGRRDSGNGFHHLDRAGWPFQQERHAPGKVPAGVGSSGSFATAQCGGSGSQAIHLES